MNEEKNLLIILDSGHELPIKESWNEYVRCLNEDPSDKRMVLTQTDGLYVEVVKSKICAVGNITED